jgi:hypothetical protein
MQPLKECTFLSVADEESGLSVSGINIDSMHRLNRPKSSSTRVDSPLFLCTPYWTPLGVKIQHCRPTPARGKEGRPAIAPRLPALATSPPTSPISALLSLIFNFQNPTSGPRCPRIPTNNLLDISVLSACQISYRHIATWTPLRNKHSDSSRLSRPMLSRFWKCTSLHLPTPSK